MLKIGDFSKLAQVSVKTLRHYSNLGLLQPAWIDRFTGYRYYQFDQLPRLNRILALKDLGFSLDQVSHILEDDLPISRLRSMLKMKQGELEHEIQMEQARLVRVNARLQQIEREGSIPAYDVVLKSVPNQQVLGIRAVIQEDREVAKLFSELSDFARARGTEVNPAAPCTALYYDVEYQDRGMDLEVSISPERALPGTGRVIAHELPAVGEMACVIYQGGLTRLSEIHHRMVNWSDLNRYRLLGPSRILYLQPPDPGGYSAELVKEVQYPVEKKSVIVIDQTTQEQKQMEVKLKSKPAFTVVGMKYHGKNENNEIPQMWGEMSPRWEDIPERVNPHDTYGVCGNLEEDGSFSYVAGVEVSSTENTPIGMKSWEVPASLYAIFPCTLKTIGETYKYAFETWLPSSIYDHHPAPDFEFYDETFKPEDPESLLYIYIPIQKSE
jgi:predicted transcriptional regulator YdeE/DNA-binding transcriptional MerR regulator